MNIGLMTSTSKRHAYFVHEIMKKVDLKIVILEEKPSFTNTRMKYSEEYFFGEYAHIKTAKRIKVGEINSESMIDFSINDDMNNVNNRKRLFDPSIDDIDEFIFKYMLSSIQTPRI